MPWMASSRLMPSIVPIPSTISKRSETICGALDFEDPARREPALLLAKALGLEGLGPSLARA
jgi:hypothetical protein